MSDDTLKAPTVVEDTLPAVDRGAPVQLPVVDAASYELRELLGAGGMGKVVVARDRRLGRILAVKVAHTTQPALRARFTREAVLTARLQHPSIIPVHEAGVLAGEPFYAMKLVAGRSLTKVIAATRELDERLALIPNVIAVADALAYAHAQRVIHRDLKPDNVIVGEYGETIVIDWGLAKELDAPDTDDEVATSKPLDASKTVEGAAMGTPPYMAPEQAAGEPADERTDVYGLGALLYHVLCGAAPYTGATADAVMEQVLTGPPIALATRQVGIPGDLLALVDKAMAREPRDRYPDAKQLADDLRRFQRGQLVAAHVYSRGELARRWLARHRALVGIAAAIMTAVIVVAVIWVRAEMRERASSERRIVDLLHADETDRATAAAQLAAGKFAEAADTLGRVVPGDDSRLAYRRDVRTAQYERVRRIATFYEHASEAAFLVGEEDRGDDAIRTLGNALRQLGAIDATGRFASETWWSAMPVDELTPAQRRDVLHEAYRQVLLLAFMHLKVGGLRVKMDVLSIAKSPEAAAQFRRSLEVIEQAPPLERALGIQPARVAVVWQRISRWFLERVGTAADLAQVKPPPAGQPDVPALAENAADYFSLGVGQFVLWQTRGTPAALGMQLAFPDAFDYQDPLAAAERLLRTAIIVDPRQYWPHFMLGWTLRERGNPAAAELVLGTCVSLQPDNALGYGQRAQALAERAKREPDPVKRKEITDRSLADSATMLTKAPNHPVTYWSRGDLMRFLGDREAAVEAYTRALELEDTVATKYMRQVVIGQVTRYAETELAGTKDADHAVLRALLHLHDAKAAAQVDEALAIDPQHPRAIAIRGTLALERGELDRALADFDRVLAAVPTNQLAASGRARVLERRAAEPRAVLAAYDVALARSATPAQLLQAQLGRQRALMALGRTQDALAALAAAFR